MESFVNLTSIKKYKKLLDKEYNESMKDEYFNKIVELNSKESREILTK